jgi:hypothetical protein
MGSVKANFDIQDWILYMRILKLEIPLSNVILVIIVMGKIQQTLAYKCPLFWCQFEFK